MFFNSVSFFCLFSVAFGIIELILAPFMIIITVTSSAYACHAVCCRNSEKNPEDFSVINAEGQRMTIQDLQGANLVVHPNHSVVSQEKSIGKF
jgi:hypothetical protein